MQVLRRGQSAALALVWRRSLDRVLQALVSQKHKLALLEEADDPKLFVGVRLRSNSSLTKVAPCASSFLVHRSTQETHSQRRAKVRASSG